MEKLHINAPNSLLQHKKQHDTKLCVATNNVSTDPTTHSSQNAPK
jgi:hypothetical protein